MIFSFDRRANRGLQQLIQQLLLREPFRLQFTLELIELFFQDCVHRLHPLQAFSQLLFREMLEVVNGVLAPERLGQFIPHLILLAQDICSEHRNIHQLHRQRSARSRLSRRLRGLRFLCHELVLDMSPLPWSAPNRYMETGRRGPRGRIRIFIC